MQNPESSRGSPSTALLNEQYFSAHSNAEFVGASPHLKHANLNRYCLELAREAFRRIQPTKNAPAVLDMGAGDGMLTMPFLEMGAHVTAADATQTLLDSLARKAANHKSRLTLMAGDIFETLERFRREGKQFDLVSASSFFHHIPDYLRLCREAALVLNPGGVFFSFQDPLRYDSLSRATYWFDRASYFGWRLFQGNYLRGLKTRCRRLAGNYRDDLPEDSAEYHVVRNGVDQDAIKRLLEAEGLAVEIQRYWSTQSTLFQKAGVRLRLVNSFAIIASKGRDTANR